MKYGSVVLDMDGVILDFKGDDFKWKYDAVRKVLEEEGVDPGGFSREQLGAFMGDKGVRECIEKCNESNLDAEKVWTKIAEETSHRRAEKIKEGEFTLFPEVRETLEELHSLDIELGVISNAPEMAIEETISYFDLKKFFKFYRGIEDFEDLTDRKPHPDHLEFARAELKREPFIYAGDAESDIMAAKNAGMESVWVKREEGTVDTSPDYTVSSLEELMEIVRE